MTQKTSNRKAEGINPLSTTVTYISLGCHFQSAGNATGIPVSASMDFPILFLANLPSTLEGTPATSNWGLLPKPS